MDKGHSGRINATTPHLPLILASDLAHSACSPPPTGNTSFQLSTHRLPSHMFIELTDHLRCPEEHEEGFLVLLPDEMEGRSVRSGQLGCPICGRTFAIQDGIVELGDAPGPATSESRLDAEGLTALAGLHGPGGYFALVGSLGSLGQEMLEVNPGVSLIAVNPPAGVVDSPGVSVIRSGRIPLKTRSMRGVALGRPYADDPFWIREAARVVLPGLRIVGEGADPPADVIELMASAEGVWVGVVKR
jgi:uncharacterized protein YbaR (Trm112 family)